VNVRTRLPVALLALFALGLAISGTTGCGKGSGGKSAGSGSVAGPAATFAAADGPIDHEAAERGQKIFAGKGCSACHAFGKRITGPDLAGVTQRRSRKWMTSQMQHPEVMTKEDPVARELFAKYMVQMPNLKVSDDEAHAIVEYFKTQDHPGNGKEQ
jgi:cytochrome c551/c552